MLYPEETVDDKVHTLALLAVEHHLRMTNEDITELKAFELGTYYRSVYAQIKSSILEGLTDIG
jgi:hypothetical protein